MDIEEIDNSMPLHDFPKTYNSNNKTFRDAIIALQQKLDAAETKHKEDMSSMMRLYREMSAKYEELSDKFENMKNSSVSTSTFEQSVKQIINNQTGK